MHTLTFPVGAFDQGVGERDLHCIHLFKNIYFPGLHSECWDILIWKESSGVGGAGCSVHLRGAEQRGQISSNKGWEKKDNGRHLKVGAREGISDWKYKQDSNAELNPEAKDTE